MISHLPSILLQTATVTDTVDLEEQVEKTLTGRKNLGQPQKNYWK